MEKDKSQIDELIIRICKKEKSLKKIDIKATVGIFSIGIILVLAVWVVIQGFPEWAINNKYIVISFLISLFVALAWIAYKHDRKLNEISERCPACGLRLRIYHIIKILENERCPRCGHALNE